VGMRNFHIRPNKKWCPIINLDKLWSLVTEQTRKTYKDNKDGKAPVIDVVRAGYYKVLGKGVLPKQPVIVKAKFFSRSAEEKIKAVGEKEEACLEHQLLMVQEKALMKDLQSYFRHRMALMLQGSFIPFNMSRDSQTTQAVNWLIAEHLVHYNYHFTLSVMKSEAPIHDNLPKISAAKSEGVRQVLSVVPSAISNVCNILGLNPRGIMSEYQRGRASLLECLLESLSHAAETKTSMIGNSIQEQENFLQRLRSVDEHYEKLKRDVSPGKKEAIQMESLMEVDSEKEKKDAMAARVIETQEELELLKQELQALKAIFSVSGGGELKAAVSEVAAEMLSARCLLTELKSFIVQGPQRQAEMQQEAQVIAYNPIHGISGAGSTRDQKEDSSDKLSVPGLMKSPTGNGQNQHLEGKLLQLEDKLSSTLKELEYLRQEHQGLKSLNHALQKQMKVQQRPGPSFSESRIPLVEEQDEVIEDEDSSWSSGTKEFLQGSRERLKALEREAEMLMKRYQGRPSGKANLSNCALKATKKKGMTLQEKRNYACKEGGRGEHDQTAKEKALPEGKRARQELRASSYCAREEIPFTFSCAAIRGGSHVVLILTTLASGAVIPPPWANTATNPCAKTSWQLVYWPQDGQCYRIFHQGPCPPSFELRFNLETTAAECTCPHGTKMWLGDGRCYREYARGPCMENEFFVFDEAGTGETICRKRSPCPEGQLFWPRDGLCYKSHSRGPCFKGDLIHVNAKTGEVECGCDQTRMPRHYWPSDLACYEHYSKGPCNDGYLFIHNRTHGLAQCSCNEALVQHYHPDLDQCHPLNVQGPCARGQWYVYDPEIQRPRCTCRPRHAPYKQNGGCYREFTRGPCPPAQMLVTPEVYKNEKLEEPSCVEVPCRPGWLYFPEEEKCYRIGTQGPCPSGKLVIYEPYHQTTQRGTCACSSDLTQNYWEDTKECFETGTRGPCQESQILSFNQTSQKTECVCDFSKAWVQWPLDGECYKLGSQGPCMEHQRLQLNADTDHLECACEQGYTYDSMYGACFPKPALEIFGYKELLKVRAARSRKSRPVSFHTSHQS
ncbi:unnamed protein product, partial [Darwinula stevensoni]